jgi:opacity protein-like surface antigen
MGMRAILTGVTVSLVASGVAYAADMGRGGLKDVPYVETASNWSGLYGGVTLGYGSGSSTTYLDRADNHGSARNDPDGGLFGLTVGYNWQMAPQWILGVEADLSYADISGAQNLRIWDGHYWGGSWDSFASLRGRVGYSLGSTLIYGTAGIAGISSSEFVEGNTVPENTDGRGWRAGWVIGAGVEHMFTDRISGKIEYLHAGFEDVTGFDKSNTPEPYKFASDLDLIRVGLNYKIH